MVSNRPLLCCAFLFYYISFCLKKSHFVLSEHHISFCRIYLVCRDMVVLYQFSLDFRIDIEVSTGLVSTQVRENELRPFLCIILLVIVIEHLGTVTCLVVDMV